MYHQKIEEGIAVPVTLTQADAPLSSQPLDPAARFFSILIILGAPLILLWLLARFAWNDIKAVSRGIATFYRAVAEELSRS